MARKIITGDTVVVMRGNHRGQSGEVISVLTEKERVVVKGVNIIKRHTKPSGTQQGGIIELEGSIAISNVMLVEADSEQGTRVGFRLAADGKKVRFAKKSGNDLS